MLTLGNKLRSGQGSTVSLFSKKKKLIISGCSYTDNYAKEKGIDEFDTWGQILADKLDMELVNLAKCGYGNQAIYTTLVERILEEKNIGLVVSLWSEFQRVAFYLEEHIAPKTFKEDWVCFHPEREVLDVEWHDQFYKPPNKNPRKDSLKYKIAQVLHRPRNIGTGAIESVNLFYSFQSICENLELPYLQAQGCLPLMAKTDEVNKRNFHALSKYIIDRPQPMSKNFIGWPIIDNIGGWCMDDCLHPMHRLSDEDTHPNEDGHKLIAETFYDEYKKIYS